MKSIKEVEQNIIKITSKIHQEFPELSDFIKEMPENNSEEEALNLENLEEYYFSLLELLNQYRKSRKISS